LENGAEVDVKDMWGEIPLHYVAWSMCMTVAQLLLKHGAKPDVKDEFGETPLEEAKSKKRNRSQEMINLLRKHSKISGFFG
jgi:ankyrin repeat protein